MAAIADYSFSSRDFEGVGIDFGSDSISATYGMSSPLTRGAQQRINEQFARRVQEVNDWQNREALRMARTMRSIYCTQHGVQAISEVDYYNRGPTKCDYCVEVELRRRKGVRECSRCLRPLSDGSYCICNDAERIKVEENMREVLRNVPVGPPPDFFKQEYQEEIATKKEQRVIAQNAVSNEVKKLRLVFWNRYLKVGKSLFKEFAI